MKDRSEFPQSVVDRILSRMKVLGLRQVDLIRFTGASKGTVNQWVAGTNSPSSRYLYRLAIALQCDPSWIVNGGSDIGEPPKMVLVTPDMFEQSIGLINHHKEERDRLIAQLAIEAIASKSTEALDALASVLDENVTARELVSLIKVNITK